MIRFFDSECNQIGITFENGKILLTNFDDIFNMFPENTKCISNRALKKILKKYHYFNTSKFKKIKNI